MALSFHFKISSELTWTCDKCTMWMNVSKHKSRCLVVYKCLSYGRVSVAEKGRGTRRVGGMLGGLHGGRSNTRSFRSRFITGKRRDATNGEERKANAIYDQAQISDFVCDFFISTAFRKCFISVQSTTNCHICDLQWPLLWSNCCCYRADSKPWDDPADTTFFATLWQEQILSSHLESRKGSVRLCFFTVSCSNKVECRLKKCFEFMFAMGRSRLPPKHLTHVAF